MLTQPFWCTPLHPKMAAIWYNWTPSYRGWSNGVSVPHTRDPLGAGWHRANPPPAKYTLKERQHLTNIKTHIHVGYKALLDSDGTVGSWLQVGALFCIGSRHLGRKKKKNLGDRETKLISADLAENTTLSVNYCSVFLKRSHIKWKLLGEEEVCFSQGKKLPSVGGWARGRVNASS